MQFCIIVDNREEYRRPSPRGWVLAVAATWGRPEWVSASHSSSTRRRTGGRSTRAAFRNRTTSRMAAAR
eukprot:CAMPEP_0119328812 /NCGR_PEP_ID=MMETSP1333-20130426/74307_1 /TAXON_ID=418940 /ORGANISM="Scyphosphaera apsteinii, Strain RCC1455" /LENGTH=68 /DNA_ID=CAMNT_0007337785 /DNA_START=251 /DNA_END=457 /DNA_ORIENTATION=+